LQMVPTLEAMPGVEAAAAAMKLPLRGPGQNWGIRIPGKPELSRTTTAFRVVTRDYFAAMGMRMIRGRGFSPADREGSEPVVVINEALAEKYFPGEDPIGRVINTFGEPGERIIGIVNTVAEANLTDAPVPARYMLYEHVPVVWHQVSFVVKATRTDEVARLLDATRSTLLGSRELAVQRLTTLESVLDLALGAPLRVATLLALLAGLALLLGAVGIYGVVAGFVNRRRRDYGIRLALGLLPTRVVWQIVGRGCALAVVGSVIGLIATIVTGRRLATLLYGVRPEDTAALAAACVALVMVAAVASLIPAWRASRTDPAVVLREP
jgi:putative ABC transport system permease protein